MRTKITLLSLLAFLCLLPDVFAQCTFGTQNPSQTYTPVYDENEYIIHSNSHPGEYMLIKAFSTATVYKFRSSQPTDYITITDANGAQIFANGLNGSNGINFTPPYPQVIRFYIHANAQCESNPFSTRTRYLKTTITTYSCDSPSNISVSNITSNSAKVSWNAPVIGTEFSYEVYANTSGVAPAWNANPTVEAPVGLSAQLSGLNPGSTYYYWVRSQCVADAGIWVPAGSFTTNSFTACNGAPYGLYPEETFTMACNGTVEQIAADAYPGEYSNMYVSSNQQYTFSSSVSTDFITITDPTGVTVYTSGQTPLTWINNSNWGTIRYYLHTNSACGTAATARIKSVKCGGNVVGGCTSGDLHPTGTFTPTCTGSLELVVNDAWAGEFSNINVSANKEYTFSSSVSSDYVTIVNPTGNVVLATGPSPLVWNSATTAGVVRYYLHTNVNCGTQDINRQRYIKCSNVTVPTCGLPSALSVTNITSNSSRLNWTAPASAPGSGYDLYIVTTNTAPVAATAATVTSTTAGVGVLSGLAAATTYYYWIRSNCGTEKSAWVSGGSFTTNASLVCNGAVNGLYPEATFTPACTGSAEQIVTDAWAGEYANVNVSANKQYTFTSSVATDFITITNTAGTAVLASGLTPLSWASGNTTGIIRYHINTNSSCGTQNTSRIRSIQCTNAASTCGSPSALAVTNITSNSCRITWTAPAAAPSSGYDMYIVTTNTAPVAATAATVTSTTAGVGVLSGLAASTTYYYWIRSNCGTEKSAWVSGGSFATNAALTCNGAINGLYPDATFTPSCTGSNEQIVADAYAGEYSNVNVSANKQYTFTSSVATDFITITNAAGTLVLASGTTPLNWASGNTTGIIRYHINTNINCGTQNTSRVRSIKCTNVVTPTCGLPFEMYASNITSNSVQLNWVGPTPEPTSGYEIYVATSNTAPVAASTPTTSSSSWGVYPLMNLNPNTTYYYWVRSNCGNTKSAWVSGGSFTTIPALTCNGAILGLWPPDTYTPNCTGSNELVTDYGRPGSYSNVVIWENHQYTFTSSVATDFITITNESGTVVLASGTSPLVYSTGDMNQTVVRFHTNTNVNCGVEMQIGRMKYVKCAVLSIDDQFAESKMKVYPNPSSGQFTVETGNVTADQIVIYDSLGRLIKTGKPSSAKTSMSVNGLADGIYYVKIQYQDKDVTRKLVLEKN